MSILKENPFLFVVGCPRSGTTLLQRMLDNHSSLAVANDTHFIPRVLDKTRPDSLAMSQSLIESTLNYRRFRRLGLNEKQVHQAAGSSRDYREFIAKLYTQFARERGKQLGCEKTPDYVKRITLLSKLFPDARFLHIVRDGRNVALSAMDWADDSKGPGKLDLWKENPLVTCALWWRWHVLCGVTQGEKLGPNRYQHIRYEDLTQDPERVLGKVCGFLNLPYDEAMVDFHVGKTRNEQGLSAKSAWKPVTRNLRNWKETLSVEQCSQFEVFARNMLICFDYEPVSKFASIERNSKYEAWMDKWDAVCARKVNRYWSSNAVQA